jgi:hypothetical protein
MKKPVLLFYLLFCINTVFCQQTAVTYDSAFQDLYKQVALHPVRPNRQGKLYDPVIKKWDQNIAIFIEGGNQNGRDHIEQKLKKVITEISPALNNKIKFSFVSDKSTANYLIKLDTVGNNASWYLRWDVMYNIYNCVVTVDTKTVFNLDEQAGKVASDFLKSLGDFSVSQLEKPVSSNMVLWRRDITETDLRILGLQYSDDIKSGMREKDIDKYFFSHSQ